MLNGLFVRNMCIVREIPARSYLNGLDVVTALKKRGGIEFTKRVTFLVGENGVGKSTLIEALAVYFGFNPEGGTKNFVFSTKDTHSDLYRYISVGKGAAAAESGFFFRAESFYNTASYVDSIYEDGEIPDFYGGRSLHCQSHGESFLAIAANRFVPNGLYIMDEPESALSPMRQMELMYLINMLTKEGCQFIISTHSPMLITLPGAEVLEISEGEIKPVDYRKTEHFQIMKRFLDDPDRMLRYLLE